MCIRDSFGIGLHPRAIIAVCLRLDTTGTQLMAGSVGLKAVSYTHLRAHETPEHLVCRLLLEKKNGRSPRARPARRPVPGAPPGGPSLLFFFNDTATTEIYTRSLVGSVRCV